MSTRGDNARAKILSVSRKLFSEKGYSKVTMQDICTAANISRGGLYRHYSSTEEIFTAIIKKDESDALDYLAGAVLDHVPAEVMFKTFIKLRISILLNPSDCIDNAISEFAANSKVGKELLIERANNSIQILSEMIDLGCTDGSFRCADSKSTSKMILWILEGMGKHNALIPLTSDEINEQIDLIDKILTSKI